MDIVERLDWLCTDWDQSQMVDGEPPLDDVRVGDLRKAAAEITRLRARLAEAEKVIKPFADLSAVFSKQDADELWCFMRLLHLRAAARWMEGKQ